MPIYSKSVVLPMLQAAGYPIPANASDTLYAKVLRSAQLDLGLTWVDAVPGNESYKWLSMAKLWQQPVGYPHVPALEESLRVLFGSGSCGYVSNTTKDVKRLKQPVGPERFMIGRMSAQDAKEAFEAGNRFVTHGLTCGHFVQYWRSLVEGDVDNKYAATGMHLAPGSWKARAPKWRDATPSSSCTGSLVDGEGIVENWEKDKAGNPRLAKYKVRGYASSTDLGKGCSLGAVVSDVLPSEHPLVVIEMAKHCRLVQWLENVTDPRHGLAIIPGWYLMAADYATVQKDLWRHTGTGMPWTFRLLWRGLPGQARSEPGQARHRWLVPTYFKSEYPACLQP